MVALILGLQQGFTKYCSFICEWNSRARSLHYSRKDWLARKSLEPGIMNVENQPLVELIKFFVAIHVFQAWSDKKFCKGHEPRRSCLYLLTRNVSRLREAKLEEGIFIGPQIRDLIKDEYFDRLLQGDENTVWERFKFVVIGFLENRRAQNYEDLVNKFCRATKN